MNKMKSILTLSLFISSLLAPTSSQALVFGGNSHKTDPKLVGIWEGETIQEDGTIKKWRQERKSNGRYVIQFRYYEGEELVDAYVSQGKWWMSEGRFCEIGDELDGQHFEYKVSWTSDTCIKMTSVKRNPDGDEYDGYTFTECRIENPTN
jgi:hypothetical protein